VPSWLDFNQIADWVSGAWWSYPLIFSVAMVDAFFPVVPSETVVIIGGNLAASGDLNLAFVILLAAAGAIVGDNISYAIGMLIGERTVKRWFSGEKSRRRLEWAERTLDERGAYIILIARFIPGGRVAVTFSAGSLNWEWPRFIRWDVLAGILWASYAAGLGYFGGKTFEDHPFRGFLIAFAAALAVTGLVEFVRWFRKRAAAHT